MTSLNKLDCGDQEQLLLSSRDNNDLLVVSFTDVRRCLESSFIDLDQQANQISQPQQTPSSKTAPVHAAGMKMLTPESYSQSTTFVSRQHHYLHQTDRNVSSSADSAQVAHRSRNSNSLGGYGGKGRGATSYSSSSVRPGMNPNNSFINFSNEGLTAVSQRSEIQNNHGRGQGQCQDQVRGGMHSYSHAQQQQLLLQQQQLKLKVLQQHMQQQQQQQGGWSALGSQGDRYSPPQMGLHNSDGYIVQQQRQQQQHSSSTISGHIQRQRLEHSAQNILLHSSALQQQLLQRQQQQLRGQTPYY